MEAIISQAAFSSSRSESAIPIRYKRTSMEASQTNSLRQSQQGGFQHKWSKPGKVTNKRVQGVVMENGRHSDSKISLPGLPEVGILCNQITGEALFFFLPLLIAVLLQTWHES